MKKRLHFFLLLSVFWLFLFIVSRILFLVYQFAQASQLSAYEIVIPLMLGLLMDNDMQELTYGQAYIQKLFRDYNNK